MKFHGSSSFNKNPISKGVKRPCLPLAASLIVEDMPLIQVIAPASKAFRLLPDVKEGNLKRQALTRH